MRLTLVWEEVSCVPDGASSDLRASDACEGGLCMCY